MQLFPVYPKAIFFSVRGIYIALTFLTAAVISEWFEPFDGGGGTGPLLLPITFFFILFFAILGWVNGRILKKKNWVRILLTVFLTPWSMWQIYSMITEFNSTLPAILYSMAALVSIVSVVLFYQHESNTWFRLPFKELEH